MIVAGRERRNKRFATRQVFEDDEVFVFRFAPVLKVERGEINDRAFCKHGAQNISL